MGALDISYSLLPFMFPTKRKKSLKQMDLPSWYEELLGCTIKGHYCYLPFLPSKSLFQIVLWFYRNFISLLIILWEERLQLSKVSRADEAQPAPKKPQMAEHCLKSISPEGYRGVKMRERYSQLAHRFSLRVKPLLSVSFWLFTGTDTHTLQLFTSMKSLCFNIFNSPALHFDLHFNCLSQRVTLKYK